MNRVGKKTTKILADFTLELVNETDKALLVKNEKDEDTWLPKSAIVAWSDNKDGTCTITCTEEFATDKELC